MVRLDLTRGRILGFRRRVAAIDERRQPGADAFRQAAWAGLQDSMPRAALLSLCARIEGAGPQTWDNGPFVQLWGPRFNVYVVAEADLAVFSLGRLPEDPPARARAYDTAARLRECLDGRELPFGQAGRALQVHPNSLRYAALTGGILLRWDGARQPVVRAVPAPDMEPGDARRELVRRYLHVMGPATAASFAKWAGVYAKDAQAAWETLEGELMPVRTPLGEAWILSEDEPMFRAPVGPAAPARFLPSGDAYTLLWGEDRHLLVADARHRAALWTTRVWPGALLVGGEVAGVWRRSASDITIALWRRLAPHERDAVEEEATTLQMASPGRAPVIRWD